MEVVAKKDFLHDQLGRVRKGQKITVNERQLRQLKDFGWVDIPTDLYETKVTTDHPSLGRGEAQPSSVSQAAPVSPQTTAEPSKRGRGRPRKSGE